VSIFFFHCCIGDEDVSEMEQSSSFSANKAHGARHKVIVKKNRDIREKVFIYES